MKIFTMNIATGCTAILKHFKFMIFENLLRLVSIFIKIKIIISFFGCKITYNANHIIKYSYIKVRYPCLRCQIEIKIIEQSSIFRILFSNSFNLLNKYWVFLASSMLCSMWWDVHKSNDDFYQSWLKLYY